jgi:hypothetical protein
MRGYPRTIERYVAEILDHESIATAFGERDGIREHKAPDFFEAQRAPWRARQGRNVNHADDCFAVSKHRLPLFRSTA